MNFDCPHRILFGPLYTGSILGRWLDHPNLLTFGPTRTVTMSEKNPFRPLQADLHYDYQHDGFAQILAALPPGWEPDLVIWYNLSLFGVPPGIEDCPYPTLAIVHDAHLNLATLLDYVKAFDFVVADRGFVELLARQGFERAAYWPCYAHDPLRHYLIPGLERPYDVVFPGNMSYHFHGERNRWLQRLSRLDDRYQILITDRVYGDEYLRLLNQSKLVFNYSVRAEMNMRLYEAAACGAVVLCERENREIGDFLVDGESCVLYDEANFEAVIAYYLEQAGERQRIAANGVRAIATQDCEHQFARLLALLPQVRQAFASGARKAFRTAPVLWKRLLQEQQFAQSRTRKTRPADLTALVQAGAALSGAEQAHWQAVVATMGLSRCWDATRLLQPGPLPADAPQLLTWLEASVRALPGHLWHAYNLACAYTLFRQPAQALGLWAQLLPRLQQPDQPLDAASLSWLHPAGPRPFCCFWDSTAGTRLQGLLGQVLAGHQPVAALFRLMLAQAYELSGYALMWLQQWPAAIQAFYQAAALGPPSYFTYTPLLRLLLQQGRQAELLVCLQQATDQLGLVESHHRDLIGTLLAQGKYPQLPAALQPYRQLLSRVEGGGPQAVGTPQTWLPQVLLWLPESLEQQLEGASGGVSRTV